MIRIFKVPVATSVLVLVISEAILLTCCYVAAVYVDPNFADAGAFLLYETGLGRILIVVGMLLAGMYLSDLYSQLRIKSHIQLLQQVCVIIGFAFIVEALLAFGSSDWSLPRRTMLVGSVLSIAVIFGERLLFRATIEKAAVSRRVLFWGLSPTVLRLTDCFTQHREFGMEPIGYLNGTEKVGAMIRLGSSADLISIAEDLNPHWIVIRRRDEIPAAWLEDLVELRYGGIQIEEAARVYEMAFGRVCTAELRPQELVFRNELQPSRFKMDLQSVYSIAFVVVTAVVTVPLILLAALMIRLTSPGPVLVRENRIGLHGNTFAMYQFRWNHASSSDPTPMGRVLRQFRLEVLPRIWNVLRGEMSIVGPRAEQPEFVTRLGRLIPYYHQRFMIRPGLTGWAQTNANSSRDALRALEYDLYYLKNFSAALDFLILFRSIKMALTGTGPD